MENAIYRKNADYDFFGYRSVKMNGNKRLTFPKAFREDILRAEGIDRISQTGIHYMIEEREMQNGDRVHVARLIPKRHYLGELVGDFSVNTGKLIIRDNRVNGLRFFANIHMAEFDRNGRMTLSEYPEEYVPGDGRMLMVGAGQELLLSGFL